VKGSQVAYKAADLISERGHCKQLLEDAEGRLCVEGALWTAASGRSTAYFTYPAASTQEHMLAAARTTAILCARYFPAQPVTTMSPILISEWNDLPETNMEDAVLLLKQAGKELDDEGL
jgi:hypothetical protein